MVGIMTGEWYANGQPRTAEQQAVIDTATAAAATAALEAQLDVVEATPGAEASNARTVACAIKTLAGAAIASARAVRVTSRAATNDKGDLAAADTPVGSLVGAAENPATGSNVMHMITEANGTFSFKVSDDAGAENVVVVIEAEGCVPRVLTLSFAA